MRFALLGLFAVACSPDVAPFPTMIGGSGGTGGTGSDQGSSGTLDAGSDELAGLVCVLPDPRDFATCQASGAGGITVALSGVGSAVTADDGTFTIPVPTGTNLTWTISGPNMIASTMGFSTSPVVFAITEPTFDELLELNGMVYEPALATVIGQVQRGGSGLPLATVDAAPIGTPGGTFYATTDDLQDWPGTSTSTLGTFMINGLGSATETLTVAQGSGSAELITNVPMTFGGVTFVSAQL